MDITTGNNIMDTFTQIPDISKTACNPNSTDIPHSPINLTVLGIYTTSVIIQWALSCDVSELPGHVSSFEVHVDPVSSNWMNSHDLVAFVVTRLSGSIRQYKLKALVPETTYSVYLLAVSNYGTSNNSEIIQFRTKEVTATEYPTIHVRPIEAVLVFAILSTWFLTIVWFLRKWATLRILHPSEYRYSHTPPKNLETIKVVRTEDDSVIYRNYGKDYHRTMEARQKRLDRMQTMPNLNIQLPDFPETNIKSIQSKLSKSLEDASKIDSGSTGVSGVGFNKDTDKNLKIDSLNKNNKKESTLEIFPEESSEQSNDNELQDSTVHSTTV